MPKDKRVSRTLTKNIEFLEKRSKPYRVRFRALGGMHDFGYFEDYLDALVMRNLVAMRLGRDIVEDDAFNGVDDATIERLEQENQEALDRAGEIGESAMTIKPGEGRVSTRRLQEQVNALIARVDSLERQFTILRTGL